MRFYFILVFLAGCILSLQAQTDSLVYNLSDTTIHIDVQPEFPGGEVFFAKFIQSRLTYPDDAKKQGTQGITCIEFVIEKDGSLSNIKAVEGKSLGGSCDKEAIRVISSSPKWKPGMKDGVPIRTKKYQRIRFSLDNISAGTALTVNGKELQEIDASNDTTLFLRVDRMPVFAEKNISFYQFVQKNLVYPKDAKQKKIKGYVLVSFVVEKDGTTSNIHIVPGRGLYPSCDQAAIDVVSKFPTFIPGQHKGKLARVKQTVVVSFE
jgi:TonB family protein